MTAPIAVTVAPGGVTSVSVGEAAGPAGPVGPQGPQGPAGGVTSVVGQAGAVTGAQIAADPAVRAAYVSVLKPQAFGAVGDGAANDGPALTAMYAATGGAVQFERGKTYKSTSDLTITKDTDLTGATLNVTGTVTITTGVRVYGGTISATVQVTTTVGAADVTTERVQFVTATGSGGFQPQQTTGLRILNCTFTGSGNRGIELHGGDDWLISGNVCTGLSANGAYGIVVSAVDGQTHGRGTIIGNRVVGCYFGICVNGGEADPAQPGYAATMQWDGIVVANNVVDVSSSPDTLVGAIWATRTRGLLITGNRVIGGLDVGIDFEFCQHSAAVGNIVTDITNGGLAAIFGCSDILFEGNEVHYSRTKAGSSTVVGAIWPNTSNLLVLLRDNPQRVTLRGNNFTVDNGTLGQIDLSSDNTGITFAGNRVKNGYISAASGGSSTVFDLLIADNLFRFDININRPVIWQERVTRYQVLRNTIRLAAGDTPPDPLLSYVCVYDASAPFSDEVYIVGNTVDDRGANNGIGIHSSGAAIHAWISDNRTDRISTYSGTATTNWTYDRNYQLSTVAFTKLTAHDNPATVVTTPTIT